MIPLSLTLSHSPCLYVCFSHRGFLPSIGPLITYKEPLQVADDPEIGTVRIDTGVFEGGTISMYYDPMISKLCTWAPTR